jgi:hypothetical protein
MEMLKITAFCDVQMDFLTIISQKNIQLKLHFVKCCSLVKISTFSYILSFSHLKVKFLPFHGPAKSSRIFFLLSHFLNCGGREREKKYENERSYTKGYKCLRAKNS